MRESSVSASIAIKATPEVVYELVSDLLRMGEWRPENTGGRWIGRCRGPVVGARFIGTNRRGLRGWATMSIVTDATFARDFVFETRLGPVK